MSRIIRGGRGVSILALLFFCAACYTYVPLEQPPQRTGSQLRVEVSPPPEAREAGTTTTRLMEGKFVRLQDERLLLSVPAPGVRSGAAWDPGAARDTVSIASERILLLEARRLSPTRTALAAGAVGTAVGVAISYLFRRWAGAVGDDEREELPSDPSESLSPR